MDGHGGNFTARWALVCCVVGLVFPAVSNAQLYRDRVGKYSHGDINCTVNSNRKDPIMMVFFREAQDSNVATVINGLPGYEFTSNEAIQYYWTDTNDSTACDAEGDAEATCTASLPQCTGVRYHVRHKKVRFYTDGTRNGWPYAVTSVATPHREDRRIPPQCSSHYVTSEGAGGYVAGRTHLYNALVTASNNGSVAGGATLLFTPIAYWATNTQSISQPCGNADVAGDGYVDWVGINMP